MKEKILPILKNAVKNSTFSERTFSEVAEAMSKAATTAGIEDDKLEAFVTEMLPLFSTFQGDVNNQISEAVKKVKPSKKEEEKEPIEKTEETEDKPLTAKGIAAIIAEATKPLTDKLALLESSSQKSALIQSVKNQLVSHYSIKEDLCDNVLGRIDITPESTVEDIAKNALAEYNKLASGFGLQGITEGVPSADTTPVPPSVKDIDDILGKMT